MEYMYFSTSCLQIQYWLGTYSTHVMTCIPHNILFSCVCVCVRVLNPVGAHSNCLLTPITFIIISVFFFPSFFQYYLGVCFFADRLWMLPSTIYWTIGFEGHTSLSFLLPPPLSFSSLLPPRLSFSSFLPRSLFFPAHSCINLILEFEFNLNLHMHIAVALPFIVCRVHISSVLYAATIIILRYGICMCVVCLQKKNKLLCPVSIRFETLFWLHNTRQVTDSILLLYFVFCIENQPTKAIKSESRFLFAFNTPSYFATYDADFGVGILGVSTLIAYSWFWILCLVMHFEVSSHFINNKDLCAPNDAGIGWFFLSQFFRAAIFNWIVNNLFVQWWR